ncbi:MAG: hypothetical protein ACPGJS_09890 [Flammeovirgaceae bacterium]
MLSKFTDTRLFAITLIIISYFGLTYLVHIFQIDVVLIGVFRELLTIPFLLAQVVFLVIGIVYVKKDQSPLAIISIILLALCSLITIGSFL